MHRTLCVSCSASVLLLVVVVICTLSFIGVVDAYEFHVTNLTVAAETTTSGQWLWRPRHPINFYDRTVAVMFSMGPSSCTESTAALPPLGQVSTACRFGVLITVDGGDSWVTLTRPNQYFCGSKGTIRSNKLYCPGKIVDPVPASVAKLATQRIEKEDASLRGRKVSRPQLLTSPVVVFEEVEFEIVPVDAPTTITTQDAAPHFSAALLHRPTGNYIAFDQSIFDSPVETIRGGAVLPLPERSLHLRSLEVTLRNGTTLHAFYKSTDGGSLWMFVSIVPLPFSANMHILRMSDTRIQLISGEIGHMNQTVSLYLGTKWERSESSPFVMPGSAYVGRYSTTVTSGVIPRPMLGLVAVGTQKNSQKSLLLTSMHNNATRLVAADHNFSEAFMTATTYACGEEHAAAHGGPGAGCESSGFTAIVAGDANGTILVLYDRLRSGHYHPSSDAPGDHTIYAMRLFLDESSEAAEYEARLAREKRVKEEEKEAELNAAKRRDELKRKREREEQNRRRRDKARRAEWQLRDEAAQRRAARYQQVDGDHIIVRPFDDQFDDIEKEMF